VAILDNYRGRHLASFPFVTTHDVSNWAEEHSIYVGPLTNIPVLTSTTQPERKALKFDNIQASVLLKPSSVEDTSSLQFYTRNEDPQKIVTTNPEYHHNRRHHTKYIESTGCICPDSKMQIPKSFVVNRKQQQQQHRALCYTEHASNVDRNNIKFAIEGKCLNGKGVCECLDLLKVVKQACGVDSNGKDIMDPIELQWSYRARVNIAQENSIHFEVVYQSEHLKVSHFENVGGAVPPIAFQGHHLSPFKTLIHLDGVESSSSLSLCCYNHEMSIRMKVGARIVALINLRYTRETNAWIIEDIPLPNSDSLELLYYPHHISTIAHKLLLLHVLEDSSPVKVVTVNNKVSLPLNSVATVSTRTKHSSIASSKAYLKWRTVATTGHSKSPFEYYVDLINPPIHSEVVYTIRNMYDYMPSISGFSSHTDLQYMVNPSSLDVHAKDVSKGVIEIRTRQNTEVGAASIGPLYENQCVTIRLKGAKLYYLGGEDGSKLSTVSERNNSNHFCIVRESTPTPVQMAEKVRGYKSSLLSPIPKCTGIVLATTVESKAVTTDVENEKNNNNNIEENRLKLYECQVMMPTQKKNGINERYFHHTEDRVVMYSYLDVERLPDHHSTDIGSRQCNSDSLHLLCPLQNKHILDIQRITAEYSNNATGKAEKYLIYSAGNPSIVATTISIDRRHQVRITPKTFDVKILPLPIENCTSAMMWSYHPIQNMHRIIKTHKSKHHIEWAVEPTKRLLSESEAQGYNSLDGPMQTLTATFDGPSYQCSGPYWYDPDTDSCKPAVEFLWWRVYSWGVSIWAIYSSIIMIVLVSFFVVGILFCLKWAHVNDLYAVDEIRILRMKSGASKNK
jgi:hypothetical protein